MSRICFVSYEIHPTTWGGCGVLVHHVAEKLLSEGHEIILLLDIPRHEFERFTGRDRLAFPNSHRVQAFRADELCADFPLTQQEVGNLFAYKSLRFAHALAKISSTQPIDFVEFFEYCGAGYVSFLRKLYGLDFDQTILGTRLHTSVELMDQTEATKPLNAERLLMYGMEHAALSLAESVLVPGKTFFDAYYRDFYAVDPARAVLSPPPLKALPTVALKPQEQRNKIVFLGRIFQLKGVEQLVKAAVMLLQRRMDRSLQFVFIGNDAKDSPTGGSYTAYLQHLIPPTLHGQFVFTGHVPHERVVEMLSETLFCVFPNRFESFCYALHEVAEAGLAIVANDLPAFRDSLRNDEDVLFYDGSTEGLLECMQRLLDDPELRRQLEQSKPPAKAHSTDYYAQPIATLPLKKDGASAAEALVVVLDDSPDETLLRRTIKSLEHQSVQSFSSIYFKPAGADDEGAFQWLGGRWTANRIEADRFVPLDILQLQTRDVLLVLRSGDEPQERWLDVSLHAMARRPAAFAGTWQKHHGRVLMPSLDTVPEAQPFWHGENLARVLLRTEPNHLLIDLFDANLGALGEVGYVWKAIAEHGRGTLLPEPWMHVGEAEARPPNPAHLGYLLARYGQGLRDRLSLLLADGAAPAPPRHDETLEAEVIQLQQKYGTLITRMQAALQIQGPAVDPEMLAQRAEELRHELGFIKSRASYRIPRRFRRSALYGKLRFAGADKSQLLTIEALEQRNPDSKDAEVWLLAARFSSDGLAVPWDFIGGTGSGWQLVDRAEGPAGKALVGKNGTLRFMLHGDDPVLEFLSHPWSGKVQISYGNATQVLDLYSATPKNLSLRPKSLQNKPSIIKSQGKTASAFLPHETQWLEKMRHEQPSVIALHVPRWLGVSASTCALFPHTLRFPVSEHVEPYAVDADDLKRCVQLLLECGVSHVIASGGDTVQFEICRSLRELKPSVRCDLLWHGTYVQFSEDYNWQVLKLWIEAARSGIIHTLGTVKKGQEAFFESLGCRGCFVMNYVDQVPQGPSLPSPGGPHLGIWLSGDNYRKLPYAMLAAAKMIPGAVIHGSNFSPRAMDALSFFAIEKEMVHSRPIGRAQMIEQMRRTHLSLYVTFAECAPMLPLESLGAGVPCLTGPTSHLFEDDEYLRSRLVVPLPDDAVAIARYIEGALGEREQIIKAYAAYAPGYIARARQSVREFLESD